MSSIIFESKGISKHLAVPSGETGILEVMANDGNELIKATANYDLSEPNIKIPVELVSEILELMYSFFIGKPQQKDKEYVQHQRKENPHLILNYNELNTGWVFDLLTLNHGMVIDKISFYKYLYTLAKEGLVRIPMSKKIEDAEKLLNAIFSHWIEGRIEVSSSIVLTDAGVARLHQPQTRNADASAVSASSDEPTKTGDTKMSPSTSIEHGKGYFQFHKRGENILIGDENTKKFKLLRALCNPPSVPRAIESIFTQIMNGKDQRSPEITHPFPSTAQLFRIKKIKYTIKELQKIKGLKGRLKFRFDDRERMLSLDIL